MRLGFLKARRAQQKALVELDPALIFMFFVYVLRNISTGELYYGYTSNLERRLKEHNTNNAFEIIYYEVYKDELDARTRERKLKHYGQSREHLKKRIKRSLDNKN